MDVFPESPDRNWSELPLDALSAIFAKLGVIEILMGPGLVCRSWLAAAKAPELWRFVDMTHQDVVFSKGPDVLCSMAKVMIDRSDGLMESFWALKFVTCGLVDYMAGRIHTQWLDFDPSRDLIEMENQGYENEGRRILGESHASWEARQNENAFAIAETMHELRLLQMGGNSLTDKGVHAILKGCPRLKFFDISKCYNVSDGLRVRCTKIKHVWLPGQRPIALCPDRHVTEENEGNDNGFMLHDLWEAEVQPLRGEAAMDDYAYDDNQWKDYWSPLLMLPPSCTRKQPMIN
nr:unnamed protein product [Digitaria exilis]